MDKTFFLFFYMNVCIVRYLALGHTRGWAKNRPTGFQTPFNRRSNFWERLRDGSKSISKPHKTNNDFYQTFCFAKLLTGMLGCVITPML